jgi:hypothetical protein
MTSFGLLTVWASGGSQFSDCSPATYPDWRDPRLSLLLCCHCREQNANSWTLQIIDQADAVHEELTRKDNIATPA